jgi:oligopeptide/dipeptide ABC transporter ATP-binding protein
MGSDAQELLTVRDLKKHFPIRRGLFSGVTGHVKAVDGVSFGIRSGETLGLVGESGCGKTTTGRLVLRLVDPTGGSVAFDGTDVLAANRGEMRRLRREMQVIFQDPYGSLNPRMTVGAILGQAMRIHRLAHGREVAERAAGLLRTVGLSPDHLRRHPHEFSGGQRQRIGIARALAVQPRFIVADEPVSALDVSIQAQVLNLLQDLQETFGLTYLFISHALNVVEHLCDRVAVMYLGRIVELSDREGLYGNPLHPYTRALLSVAPVPDPAARRPRVSLEGDVPNPAEVPTGCPFHPRCPERTADCGRAIPELRDAGDGHLVSCLLR